MRFLPRRQELLAIEGNYDKITISCRHRDILRCSKTRHFSSCFAPGHFNELQPKLYCFHPDIAIIFQRDRSGQFLNRLFVRFNRIDDNGIVKLMCSKMYGNGLSIKDYVYMISKVARLVPTKQDFYL